MLGLGCAYVLASVVAAGWNAVTSYQTEGGAIGAVPVLAAALIHPPLLFCVGLIAIGRVRPWADLAWWGYGIVLVVCAIVSVLFTGWAGTLKKRRNHPRPSSNTR